MDQKSELLDSNNYIVDQLKQSFNVRQPRFASLLLCRSLLLILSAALPLSASLARVFGKPLVNALPPSAWNCALKELRAKIDLKEK